MKCSGVVTVLLPVEGVRETVGLIFICARLERMEVFLDKYRETLFAINSLFVFESGLRRACPFPGQSSRYCNFDFAVNEVGGNLLGVKRYDERVSQLSFWYGRKPN